ncbi:Bgt-51266 [Blumeria graminis f. sp. tritici]|uniref:non-specific serine/threonine protein kinase n=1 Tax=Blumeria graminis f. sp. tritici TaxID=62690 RepID=A0A9X9PQL6_BLUGR|nr:Bgt-51266 [Blumeria graminis f. sp. tritici]
MSTFIDDSAHFTANPLTNSISNFKILCSFYNFDISQLLLGENADLQCLQVPLESLMTSLSYYALNNAVPSSINADMDIRLSSIQKRLALHSIQLTSFIPLINSITSNATDIEVWNEVIELVDTQEPMQSPETNLPSAKQGDARHRRCTAPYEGADQIMETLKEALRTELAGTIFENVDGFYEKYFVGTTWAGQCKEIAKRYENRPDKSTFKFPKDPTEKNVWQWIKEVQAEFIEPYKPDESGESKDNFPLRADTFHTTGPKQIKGGLAIRQIDIFIKSREKAAKAHDWRDVLVLGELTELSSAHWVDKFLQLSVYMREIFSAQPLRQFAHGFLMFGTQLQLWISWRAVGRLSEVELLMRARNVRGVATLIGSRNHVKISDHRSGPHFTEEMNRDIHPLEMKMTTAGNSLQSGSSNPDGNVELSKGVKHESESVAGGANKKLRRSERSCVLSISRQALLNASKARVRKNGKSTGLRKKPVSKTVPVPVPVPNPATTNTNAVTQDVTPETPSVPINLPAESSYSVAEGSNSSLGKRPRNAEETDVEVQTVSEPDLKRLCISSNVGESLSEAVAKPLSNQITNDPSAPAEQAVDNAKSVPAVSNADVIMADDSTVYRNRWETVIAAKPFGRAIDEKTTPMELIYGLRDAIKAHQSLYMETKILHRDISMNNIILTDPKRNDGCHGVLIDLDLAISLTDDNCSESSKTLTGTMEFMAIGLLKEYTYPSNGKFTHTYRHDLESFFFVLISACIRFGWGKNESPHIETIRKWYKGKAVDKFTFKALAITSLGFEDTLLKAFSSKFECLKDLATTLRKILFERQKTIWIATDPRPLNLYNSILKAFDDEIDKMKCKS